MISLHPGYARLAMTRWIEYYMKNNSKFMTQSPIENSAAFLKTLLDFVLF
jgi:hypothetical protein